MNIIKNPRSRICSILYLWNSSEHIENYILSLNKVSDVYVIINRDFKRKINIDSYCSLLGIYGYEIDNSKSEIFNRTEKFMDTMKYLIEIVKFYSMFVLDFDKISLPKNIDCIDKIYMVQLGCSVFKSDIISHSYREKLYSKEDTFSIFDIFRKKSNTGVNITHRTYSNMILSLNDVVSILKYIELDKEYYDTFLDTYAFDFLPSIFEKLDIKYINSKIEEVKL